MQNYAGRGETVSYDKSWGYDRFDVWNAGLRIGLGRRDTGKLFHYRPTFWIFRISRKARPAPGLLLTRPTHTALTLCKV